VQTLLATVGHRMFGIVAGYEYFNDHDQLWDKPIFKVIADRPRDGDALASRRRSRGLRTA
jgi:hypothetical protein